MRISDYVTPETLINHFAEEFGAENFMTKDTAQKAGKYIEAEFEEWKSIVKEHPIQSVIAASGLIVGLSLRFSDQFSAKKVKGLFTHLRQSNFNSFAELASNGKHGKRRKTLSRSSSKRNNRKSA